MLTVCKEAHAEVAYTSSICPCCMIINHFREKVEKLTEELKETQNYIDEELGNAQKSEPVH